MKLISILGIGMSIAVLFCGATFGYAAALPSAIDIWVTQGDQEFLQIPLKESLPDRPLFSLFFVTFDDAGVPVLGERVEDEFWVSVQAQDDFEPQENQSVAIRVEPPRDIASGAHVFALVVSEAMGDMFVLNYGTATLLFVTVGFSEIQAECTNFRHDSTGMLVRTLQNTGQGILYDEGRVVLRGIFNIPYAAVSSNPSRHRVFSGQSRTWASIAPSIPWWALGPLEYSLEGEYSLSECPRIPAGFGWIPLGGIFVGGLGILAFRRRA